MPFERRRGSAAYDRDDNESDVPILTRKCEESNANVDEDEVLREEIE